MPRASRSDVYSARVGLEIRKTRRQLGVSQAELARRRAVSPAYITALEAGRHNPTVGQLAHIAQAMQVGLDIGFRVLEREHLRTSKV